MRTPRRVRTLRTVRFPTAGTYEYVCTLHSQDMRGGMIVK
jgi:plastocyanin